uniref:Uncharacterized protein n=1 Tax=Cucumis melo TaxID=3656 RepID=A0A9I9DG81_CUCME
MTSTSIKYIQNPKQQKRAYPMYRATNIKQTQKAKPDPQSTRIRFQEEKIREPLLETKKIHGYKDKSRTKSKFEKSINQH